MESIMPVGKNRRRVEIAADVYDMLEAEARWLHIPVANLATMLCREGVERLQRRTAPIGLAKENAELQRQDANAGTATS